MTLRISLTNSKYGNVSKFGDDLYITKPSGMNIYPDDKKHPCLLFLYNPNFSIIWGEDFKVPRSYSTALEKNSRKGLVTHFIDNSIVNIEEIESLPLILNLLIILNNKITELGSSMPTQYATYEILKLIDGVNGPLLKIFKPNSGFTYVDFLSTMIQCLNSNMDYSKSFDILSKRFDPSIKIDKLQTLLDNLTLKAENAKLGMHRATQGKASTRILEMVQKNVDQINAAISDTEKQLISLGWVKPTDIESIDSNNSKSDSIESDPVQSPVAGDSN